jgi:hypothetical protein
MNNLSKILPILAIIGFIAFRMYTEWHQVETKEKYVHKWQEVVDYAQHHLPLEGVLTRKSDGFVYLKVDDQYIHKLLPMLGLDKHFHEPPFFRSPEAPGAHITVFYADEHIDPKEVGQTFHFTPKKIVVVHADRHSDYAILQVDAPELEQLRQKYGKKPKIIGREFHISLAKKTHR